MKYPIVTGSLMVLGLMLAETGVADSVMEERFRDEGRQLDLTGFLQPDNDARSRSFLYGDEHEHAFSVESAGTYVFESRVPGGQSEDYRIEAELLDGSGRVITRGEGQGRSGGLALRQRLEPGDYVLRVQGRKYGTRTGEGNSFYITVAGLDAQGRSIETLDDGQGIVFGKPGRDGKRTAFVGNDDDVATINAPRVAEPASSATASAAGTGTAGPDASGAASAEASGSASTSASTSAGTRAGTAAGTAAATGDQPATADAAEATASQAFDEIVTDVKIRARGEVLSFEVAEAGTIAITSSTFPGGEGTYRIEARVLDARDRVVAEDKGEGFDGDIDITTELEPGRYRIWVQGQKFGSVMTGVTNYELRVVQLDRR